MFGLGPLAFAAPLALLGIIALPIIWWLLRLMPPRPSRVRFPPFRLLLGLFSAEESSAKTPPWLMLLRLLTAAALIIAAAHPFMDDEVTWTEDGPLILVVDDGWSGAQAWDDKRALLDTMIGRADREGRAVALLTTARPATSGDRDQLVFGTARRVADAIETLSPSPWAVDRMAALTQLKTVSDLQAEGEAHVVWLSDGIDHGQGEAFIAGLKWYGDVEVRVPNTLPKLVLAPEIESGRLLVPVRRVSPGIEEAVQIRAYAENGQLLARRPVVIPATEVETTANLELATEVANRIVRVDLEDQMTAGAVMLLDDRWRRRPVGLLTSGGGQELPLLSSIFYLKRALDPFTEVRDGTASALLNTSLSVLVMADPGNLSEEERREINSWISNGGVAVRFAGPLLAKQTQSGQGLGQGTATTEPLLPVPLRRGDRVIGGAMSWADPATLAPFEADSPFQGLGIPADVRIARQVLARPTVDLEAKTWARLSDGTPLVTAERRGDGWLVLVHTTANTQWSNLALSGLYVEMLRRLVALSSGVVETGDGPPLSPLLTMNAFGVLGEAPTDVRAIQRDLFATTEPTPEHPPGYYGRGETRRALNLSPTIGEMGALAITLPETEVQSYQGAPAIDLRPWLLLLGLILVLIDFVVSLALRGLLRPRALAQVGAVGLLVALPINYASALDDAEIVALTKETRLAYVITGNSELDRISRLGLNGLRSVLDKRTAVELGESKGIDPAVDELAFYPLLYWPVAPGAARIAETGRQNLNRFLRNGGNILFDTGNEFGTGAQELGQLALVLDIPPLDQVPPNHVLGRSFYLLQEFPGRYAGNPVFIERAGERVNDGVSPVIAGSNGWAQAWALDERTRRPLFPAVPGGERQRELAFRFGVNLVMYTLTGNYKGDQVHLPDIMRRLGQ